MSYSKGYQKGYQNGLAKAKQLVLEAEHAAISARKLNTAYVLAAVHNQLAEEIHKSENPLVAVSGTPLEGDT
jgi:hypothetical protein